MRKAGQRYNDGFAHDSAKKGDNVGILFRDIGPDDIKRGQVICKPNSVTALKKFICHIDSTPDFLESYLRGDRMKCWFRTIYIECSDIKAASGTDNYELTFDTYVPVEANLEIAISNEQEILASGYVIESPDESFSPNTLEEQLDLCLKRINKVLCYQNYYGYGRTYNCIYNKNELPRDEIRKFFDTYRNLAWKDKLFYGAFDVPFIISKKHMYIGTGARKTIIPISQVEFKYIEEMKHQRPHIDILDKTRQKSDWDKTKGKVIYTIYLPGYFRKMTDKLSADLAEMQMCLRKLNNQ